MDWINENWDDVVAIVGGIVIAARIIVKLTPTPKDDAWFAKVIHLLKHLGLYIPIIIAFCMLPSCSVTVDPVSGKPLVTVDAASIQAISDAAVAKMNEELSKPGK